MPQQPAGEPPAGRRGGLVLAGFAVLAGLVMLAAVVAVALVRPWEVEPVAAPSPPPAPPEPEPSAVLAAAGVEASPLDPDRVRAAVDDLLDESGLGDRVGAAVVDVATGERLYGWEPDRALIPASTIKIVTAATVLTARGPAYQIPTTAVAGAEPGEVVLVGGGDPTLSLGADGYYPGAGRLDLLASQVLTALGDTPVTKVTVDSTLFTGDVYGPWTEDIPTDGYVGPVTALTVDGNRVDPERVPPQRPVPRWDEPDLVVGEAFAKLLAGTGAGGGDVELVRGAAPAGATVLGEVHSPPMQRLVEVMLTGSDNLVGEALARQVALARGEPASFEGAAAAMTAVLTDELGLDLTGGVLADGSGLSRDNRLSAGLLTDLLAATADPAGQLSGVFAGLAVVGWSGTLADRHDPPPAPVQPAVGTVRAKTGSLTGVDTLAGVVVTTQGRLLAFAVLADDVPIGRPASWVALDRIPATLATL